MTPTLTDADIARLDAQQQQPKAKPMLTDADIAAHDQRQQAAPTGPPPAMKQPEGSAPSRFFGNLVSNSPLGMLTGKNARIMVDLAHHAFNSNVPLSPETQEMLGGMVQSHVDQAQKAKAAWDRGDKVEAFGHSLATLVPLLGPAAAAAGEQIGGEPGNTDRYGNVIQQGQAPDIAGGVGAGLGVISNVVAPDVAKAGKQVASKVAAPVVRAVADRPLFKSTLNPVQQAGVDYLKSEGVFVNPGTATGNKFLKGAQALTQIQPLGATTAMKAWRGTEEGLTGLSGRLAEQAYPEPVTPESAGRGLDRTLRSKMDNLSLQRDDAYERAWRGRDDPEHTYDVPVKMVQGDEVAPGSGIYDQKPVMKSVNMPVDVRDFKERAEPIREELSMPLSQSETAQSKAYNVIGKILAGDDFIPAWMAERGLSALKDTARTTTRSGVRDVAQGTAASLIPSLQEGIDAAVAKTGDDALAGLREGRETHSKVMDVADLVDQLRKEPVQAFGQTVWGHDTGIDFVDKLAEHAPDAMRPLGRAFVGKLFSDAGNEGGFAASKTLLNRWQDLGERTKAHLFPDRALRENLDNFFQGQRMMADNPNPSGSAVVGSLIPGVGLMISNPWAGGAWLMSGYAASKLLFTEGGARLLTEGMKTSPTSARGLALGKAISAAVPPSQRGPAPPEEPPPTGGTPQGPGTPPAPGGPTGSAQAAPTEAPGIVTRLNAKIARNQSGGGRAALQQAVERNAETAAANKAKLQPPPLNLIDNPANQYQYTTPEGLPVYKAPAQPAAPAEPTPQGGSPGEPAPEELKSPALMEAVKRNAERVAANKAKLRGTSYITRPAGSPVKPALPTAPDVTIPTDAAIQQGATGARPEVSGPLQPASENQRAETQVSVPGSSRQYKARYQVIELKDLQSSHNGQTFQPNPNYKYVNDRDYTRSENQGKVVSGSSPGQFDPRYMLTDNPDASNGPPVTSEGHAMGGNGRSMMLQRVYATNPQGAKAYRNLLTLKAPQFGLDPQQIRGMKQPVLVREIDPSEFEQGGQQNAVTDFNKVGTASLRGSEKAVADSRRVSQGTLDHIAGRLESGGEDATLSEVLDGRGGAEVLNRLIQDGVISPQESAAYVDRGELTADGKTRVSKLMLGRFFRDPQQLDATPPSIRNKLERIAAPLAKVESRPQWSLAQPMQQALDLIEEARAHGQKNLDDMVSQSGLFGSQTYSPEAVALAKMLQNAKPNDLTRAVRQYAQESSEAEQGAGLFGEPPTAAESFEAAFGRHR